MATLAGISHVSLTVVDMAAARRFWTEVMGFEVVMEGSDFCMCQHRPSRLAVGFKNHDANATGGFDPVRPGLDHLAFSVADRDELLRWAGHLDAHGVPYSPLQESELGYHLNLRAPDDIAIELFAIAPGAAAALGLVPG